MIRSCTCLASAFMHVEQSGVSMPATWDLDRTAPRPEWETLRAPP